MSVMRALHDRFGFTRTEIHAIMVLTGTLVLGSAVKWFRTTEATVAPRFDYATHDSTFIALSTRAIEQQGDEPNVVPRRFTAHRETAPAIGSIDLNKATKDELIRLPGIGPSYADRILDFRERLGRFGSADQLLQVKGIGKRRLEKIRPYLRITKD
jgi:comEA protein